MSTKLIKINEIFYSIQGESTYIGLPTIFIRLSGCPLRCKYCDTEYAFYKGKRISIPEILETIEHFNCKRVCITGGEPLAQPLVLELMQELCNNSYKLSIETSGALDISKIDKRVAVVLDIKTPGSGEEAKNLWANFDHLKTQDQVKFVICSYDDFLWAANIIKKYSIPLGAEWLLSPSYADINPTCLADWLLEHNLPARLQIQLHKFLWSDAQGK